MPYIDVTISKSLTDPEKDRLKTNLGGLISIIPGKREAVLMIGIHDGTTMYFSGEKKPLTAFLEIKLFKEATMEPKSELAKKIFELFERDLGVARDDLFLTFSEYDSWGSRGELRQ
jgi:phenylpyruvate tautomerase PptA (4-oxalocrotonate tautomerase family)